MRVLLIQNDASGSAGGVDPAAVLAEHGCTLTRSSISEAAAWSRTPPDAPQRAGVERVVVAGGDGSIGCAARIAVHLDVPLGVIPAGTANDFARAMELPQDLEAGCVLAATGSRTRAVDLGDVDGTPFVNVASLGLAPAATEHAERLKGGLRSLAYPVGALLAAARTRPIAIALEVDGAPAWTGRAVQVILANSGAFGGWADTGRARDDDGALDAVIIPANRNRRQLVVDAASLRTGELAHREGVHHFCGARLEVRLRRPARIVIDGELAESDERRIVATVGPRRVRVVVE